MNIGHLNDLTLDLLRAVILAALLIVLLVRGRNSHLSRHPGALLITSGFGLILLATLLDMTDEIPGLERYVVIGDTITEAILENLFGYLLGFALILFGLIKLIPAFANLKQAEHELRHSEQRFRAIFDTIPDVVAITRISDGTVIDLNQSYDTLTGFKREELLGRSAVEHGSWVAPSDRERMIEEVRENGFVRNMEASMRTRDGTTRNCLVSAQMINLYGESHLLTIFKDISDRKRVETALRDSEERFRLIFESNPDPVVLAHLPDGSILDVNRAFVVETGLSRLEAIGHNSSDLGLWAEEQRQAFLSQLQKDGEINNLEVAFKIGDQTTRSCLLSARMLTVNNERCLLIVIRDITKEKAAEMALVEMDRIKSEFISTAAHELRTPLSTMMGFTEMLLDPEAFGGFTELQLKDFLGEIYGKGEALSRIIDDLLDISRIESGLGVRLDLQEVNLGEVISKEIDRFRIHSRGHNFRFESQGETAGKMVLVDLHRMTQAIDNLLSNSVKYSAKGSEVYVTYTCDNSFCEVVVQDSGIGMTPDQIERIYDKFYRANASDTAVSGLGIGMSIVRQIVEAHEGEIKVKSFKDKGTTVTLTLPVVFR